MNFNVDFVFIVLAFLMLYRIEKVKNGEFYQEYLSVKQSNVLKGLFSIVVVLHHLYQHIDSYLPITSRFFILFKYAGSWSVAVFFFLSGYGVQYKWINDENYINGFLKKRLKSVIPLYLIANVLYIAVSFISNVNFTLADIIKQFHTGDLIVDYSWYVAVIIIFYFCHYILMKTFKRNFNVICLSSFLICSIWIVANVYIISYGDWWSNSIYSLWLGIFWATYERRILTVLKKYYWLLLLILVIALFMITFKLSIRFDLYIQSLLFPIIVIMFVMKFKIDNNMLQYLGKISFEIYLFQGLFVNRFLANPAIIVLRDGMYYIILSLVLTIMFATFVHFVYSKIKPVINKI